MILDGSPLDRYRNTHRPIPFRSIRYPEKSPAEGEKLSRTMIDDEFVRYRSFPLELGSLLDLESTLLRYVVSPIVVGTK